MVYLALQHSCSPAKLREDVSLAEALQLRSRQALAPSRVEYYASHFMEWPPVAQLPSASSRAGIQRRGTSFDSRASPCKFDITIDHDRPFLSVDT